jgi:hypothetical protein
MVERNFKRDFDDPAEEEKLRAYMKLSPKEKLTFLYEMNAFLHKAMSEKSKQAWAKLKREGW